MMKTFVVEILNAATQDKHTIDSITRHLEADRSSHDMARISFILMSSGVQSHGLMKGHGGCGKQDDDRFRVVRGARDC